MQTKFLDKFVSIFDYLWFAERTITGMIGTEFFKVRKDEIIELNSSLFEYSYSIIPKRRSFIDDLIDEIESNLLKYGEKKKIRYIKVILGRISKNVPSFDFNSPNIDHEFESAQDENAVIYLNEFIFLNMKYSAMALDSFKREVDDLNSNIFYFENKEEYSVEKFPFIEDYYKKCNSILIDFNDKFSELCRIHKINLMDIQKEMDYMRFGNSMDDFINLYVNKKNFQKYEELWNEMELESNQDSSYVFRKGEIETTSKSLTQQKFTGQEYGKPKFASDAILDIYNILSKFFDEKQLESLNDILLSGSDVEKPLIFLSNGNRLADAFKLLYNNNLITGCEKKELESWIYRNFKYRHKKNEKDFSLDYLNNIISSNEEKCTKPILNIKNNKVIPF